MTSHWNEIAPQVEANETATCDVHGCNDPRHGLTKWCRKHRRRTALYGSPTGVGLYKNTGRVHKDSMQFAYELLTLNQDSPPVQAALMVLRRWVRAGRAGLSVPAELN